MDAYPIPYVRHELPLIALSGLGQVVDPSLESSTSSWSPLPGATIARELPDVSVSFSRALRDGFFRADGSAFPWNSSGNPQRPGLVGFKFSSLGQNLVFPRRKAAPAAQTPSEEAVPNLLANHELHSTLSPLSPTSPLFPDGLLSTFWMKKHQQDVPSVLVCFFELTSDPSVASSQDANLKNEVSRIKTALSRSGYRTRLAVVLVSDDSDDQIDDRISVIKRATGLDSKSSFFFLTQPKAQSDIATFVLNTLVSLQPVCIDYYRDLTKHSRRKKNRGYIPAPTGNAASGTSQSLSTSGWHARYDFKQGIFAEFRQEMDAAERHFASALDELFNPEGVLETTPIWSPRWEDARCLADITALRVLRCQLWRSMTSGAAESWSNYRDRTRALVDRRGKGSGTYAFAAWESRWAQIMAELIDRASLSAFEVKQESLAESATEEDEYFVINILAPPEKAYATVERLPPFHLLHHAGYWYRTAQRWAVERYQRVKAIPQDERAPPAPARTSQDAVRNKSLDTYMVLPPHEELPAGSLINEKMQLQILDLGDKAEIEFDLRRQFRMKSLIAMQRAQVLAESGSLEMALQTLLSIWTDMSWRSEGWWDLAGEVMLSLYKLAERLGQHRIATEVKWEMLCKVFGGSFSKALKSSSVPHQATQVPLIIDRTTRLSPVSVSFSFAFDKAHVGDLVPCQIAIASSAVGTNLPLKIQSLNISLNRDAWQIRVSHAETESARASQDLKLKDVSVNDGQSRSIESVADLSLANGGTHVLNFGLVLRDVGELEITNACVEATLDAFTIRCTYHQTDLITSRWWLPSDKDLIERSLNRDDALSMEVLPKPPRVQLRLSEPRSQYFTSEEVTLGMLLVNEENAAVQGSIKVNAAADVLEALNLYWENAESLSVDDEAASRSVGPVEPSGQAVYNLSFRTPIEPASLALSFSIEYIVGDDEEAANNKTVTFNFDFTRPIDAVFDLAPRLDPDSWPSFFSLPAAAPDGHHMEGIRQRWVLLAKLSSLSHESLTIENIELIVTNDTKTLKCEFPTPSPDDTPITLTPAGSHQALLPFYTRRKSLDDRRPSPLSLQLAITWRRPSFPVSTTTLPVPTMQLPPAEPRVLCTARPAPDSPGVRLLTYTIENPSMHFLTFALAMDASDTFAFSGPKARTLALTPLSRVAVDYRLLLLDAAAAVGERYRAPPREPGGEDDDDLVPGRGGKWVYPALRVADSYFNKTLRVVPAGPGVRADERKAEGGAGYAVGVWMPL